MTYRHHRLNFRGVPRQYDDVWHMPVSSQTVALKGDAGLARREHIRRADDGAQFGGQ